MKDFALQLLEKDLDALGSIRREASVQALLHDGHIWLRGISGEKQPNLAFMRLPLVCTWVVDAQGCLFPQNGLTPVGRLPEGNWKVLPEFFALELPRSAWPASLVSEQVPIRLLASETPEKGVALLTDADIWRDWALGAPKIRLQRLRFALCSDKKVLILGVPLPPLPGKEYWLCERALLPAGFVFEWPLVAALLKRRLDPEGKNVLLFAENGQWETIPMELFVETSRSAVRISLMDDRS